jgi:hypothetical protein
MTTPLAVFRHLSESLGRESCLNVPFPYPAVLSAVISCCGCSKEARTRGFTSLALASYAFFSSPTLRPNGVFVERNANDCDY